jgi:transcription elongation factor Elf1
MRMTSCNHCGSLEMEVSTFRRKDFPQNFCFVDCKSCGASRGVVDIRNVLDSYKGGTLSDRQLATRILTKKFEEVF